MSLKSARVGVKMVVEESLDERRLAVRRKEGKVGKERRRGEVNRRTALPSIWVDPLNCAMEVK